MIKSLLIRNYAIIEEVEIDFSKGLTIITGETGAGKSILLGALGLIMGRRADTKSLYDDSKKCIVEATFDIRKYDIQPFFDLHDLDYEEELVVRRELTPSGKSRAFVNDGPVNLKVLQDLSASLIDLHQQFDTLDIHDDQFQLKMLDALAENKDLLAAYRRQYRQYQEDKKRLQKLIDLEQTAAKESEFLKFQLEEFQAAELESDEQESLEEELARLTNAEDIKRYTSGAFQYLCENEQSLVGQLEELGQSLAQVQQYDSKLSKAFERFNGLIIELQDVGQELERIAEATEYDPERLSVVQERLDMIYRLMNKHQVQTIAELLEIQENLEQQLKSYADSSQEMTELRGRIAELEKQLVEIAETLRKRRLGVVDSFEQKVKGMLEQLAMNHAVLKVDFEALPQLGPVGLDAAHFLFSANKGGRLQLIRDVASGGELSRLALVTKSLVASAIPLPTLIFDEIDTGISGDVALRMGRILRQLSDHHQVVSITHSPQVASKADVHYFVYKQIKNDRTVTSVKQLSSKERITEIATMLSQNPPSDSAIENAKELLGVGVN